MKIENKNIKGYENEVFSIFTLYSKTGIKPSMDIYVRVSFLYLRFPPKLVANSCFIYQLQLQIKDGHKGRKSMDRVLEVPHIFPRDLLKPELMEADPEFVRTWRL